MPLHVVMFCTSSTFSLLKLTLSGRTERMKWRYSSKCGHARSLWGLGFEDKTDLHAQSKHLGAHLDVGSGSGIDSNSTTGGSCIALRSSQIEEYSRSVFRK